MINFTKQESNIRNNQFITLNLIFRSRIVMIEYMKTFA